LRCLRSELNLSLVLLNGQSFRWSKLTESSSSAAKEEEKEGEETVIGIARHRVWKLRRINDEELEFQVMARFERCPRGVDDDEKSISEYLQLHTNLVDLYGKWSLADATFGRLIEKNKENLAGIRILHLDLLEAVFSFICSANNNISRITQMVSRLCQFYGESVVSHSGEEFFDFPPLSAMCSDKAMESRLKEAGFGYRAGYIAKSVKQFMDNGGEQWLLGLRDLPYAEARQKLQELPGVGPKVADCICLMGLRMAHVVPVDTHILRMTSTHYLPRLKTVKTLTATQHGEIGTFYRERFGSHAGWVQLVLFIAQLKRFLPVTNNVEIVKSKSKKRKHNEEVDD